MLDAPTAASLDLDPYKTALMVVDMQYFDASRDWGEGRTAQDLGVIDYFDEYFAQIDTITPVIADLIAKFRAKHMEVIHIRVAERTKDSRDVGLKQLVRGLIVPSDSKEAEFLTGLEPADDEIVISKSASGVFAATDLHRILRNIGIDTLVFVGTSTGGCVQSAVYDATDLGYRVLVVEDACADSTFASHAACVANTRKQATTVVEAAALGAALAEAADADPSHKSGIARVEPYLPTRPFLPNTPGAGRAEPYATIFGPAIQQTLTEAHAALVLVDVQRLTCDPACRNPALMPDAPDLEAFYGRLPIALARMAELVGLCRAQEVAVFHVRTAGNLANGRDLAPKRRAMGLAFAAGDPPAAIMPEVTPAPGEAVINKPASSAFNGTALDQLLANIGAQVVILAGISVDAGIEATMRSAGDRGYGSVIAIDACAASAAVEAQLAGAERGIANVRTVAEIAQSFT